MAKATVNRTPPVVPQVESITLTLNVTEAFYVLAELANANTHVHGVDAPNLGLKWSDELYSQLSDALEEAVPNFRELSEQHKEIAKTLRSDYNYNEALEVAKKYRIAS